MLSTFDQCSIVMECVRGVKLKHNSKLSLVNLLCKYLSHQFYKYDLHIFITADEFNATGSGYFAPSHQ